MKRLFLASLLLSTNAFAAVPPAQGGDTPFPITGKVIAIAPDKITIRDAKHVFDIGRDANTPIPADLKVGQSVTVQTKFTAQSVEPVGKSPTAPEPQKK